MRRFFVISLLLLLSTFLLAGKIFSQTPTLGYTSNCGFADSLGANNCCDFNSPDFNQAKQNAKNQSPQAGGFLDVLPNVNPINMIPGLNQLYQKCYLGQPDTSTGTCICKQSVTPSPALQLEQVICPKFANKDEAEQCKVCARGGGILTQIGCIPLDVGNFISDFVFIRLIGLAGIVSLLCVIYAAIQLQISRGNPEQTKKAQEILTSCIMGLMLIIFSVFILRILGVNILQIPGFK